ncbi:hypothetical protein HF282_06880 [Acidithiobacillus ferrooxidans]|nr:hypothetical protein [Acidithiobacillus ferrooxidans]
MDIDEMPKKKSDKAIDFHQKKHQPGYGGGNAITKGHGFRGPPIKIAPPQKSAQKNN